MTRIIHKNPQLKSRRLQFYYRSLLAQQSKQCSVWRSAHLDKEFVRYKFDIFFMLTIRISNHMYIVYCILCIFMYIVYCTYNTLLLQLFFNFFSVLLYYYFLCYSFLNWKLNWKTWYHQWIHFTATRASYGTARPEKARELPRII